MRRIILIAVAGLAPLVSNAHHSVGAFFDLSEPLTISGTLVDMRWQNPHVLLTIEREDPQAGVETWEVTSGGPTLLRRLGVTSDVLTVGEPVEILGFPSRVEETEMMGVGIVLASGETLPMFPIPTLTRRFGLEFESGVHITQQAVSDSQQAADGIFRVWTYGRTANRPELKPAFTESALAGQASYSPLVDDPALRCESQGMPIVMDNPFPVQFRDLGDRIVLELEIYDIERVIHLEDNGGEEYRGTPFGYSIGTWEDNTLVVRTSGIDAPYFDDIGTPQSDRIETVERFTLSDSGDRLDYQVTITDPETLLEPVTIDWHWNWVPGEALQPYNCILDSQAQETG